MKRSSGILMPISSLPSPYGIGTLGKEAREFIDFLSESGQSWWQILPVGPTSYGDSPYQCPSTFAGNPYFIDPDTLEADGLLTRSEIDAADCGADPERADYGLLYERRGPLLRKAAERGLKEPDEAFGAFKEENSSWLPDYCLFSALKAKFGQKSWLDWPDEAARNRDPEALEGFRTELAPEIEICAYIQYLFFRQWDALREYAREKGIGIIGDLPIYVALDSADVWSEKEFFQIGEDGVPEKVAGVPPDYFNEDGQLWGNPLYDYGRMKEDGWGWWIRRIGGAAKLYDVIRIDHFRGFESYWAVPYGDTTAKNGEWIKGPGMELVGALRDWFKDTSFIAEDLGYPTPEVKQLLEDSGFPGMKVVEFAFDPGLESSDMPHRYGTRCVCYTGTHDNPPVMAWKETAPAEEIEIAREYLGLNDAEGFAFGMIRGGMASTAELFIAQMQDWLQLGTSSRMNTPGILGGNWQWRMLPGALTDELARRIARMTQLYGRSNENVWSKP
ncbi:MAG: 4-alpha-glucanotransferase [Firmicutes bacterium]|nr:4-alpha-glucanotransferase [Bacillota bacterium]